MTRFQTGLAAAIVLGLSGCTSQEVGRAGFFATDPAPGAADSAPIPLEALTTAKLDPGAAPLMLATMGDGAPVTSLSRQIAEDGVSVWSSPEGMRLTLRDGLIAGTENLDTDLVAVDPPARIEALSGTRYLRAYHHDSGPTVTVTTFDCAMRDGGAEEIEILDRRLRARKMEESCEGPGGEQIANAYWLGDDGTIWRSRQWVSAELGTIEMQRLIR